MHFIQQCHGTIHCDWIAAGSQLHRSGDVASRPPKFTLSNGEYTEKSFASLFRIDFNRLSVTKDPQISEAIAREKQPKNRISANSTV